MNIFLDANIIISVLNKEYPLFPFTSRILSIASTDRLRLFTSPLCLAISFYFAEKKSGASVAKNKIALLCKNLLLSENTADGVAKALQNPAVHDFEDGLEYYAALESNCTCIITENKKDFYFADIEVLNSTEFCKQYLF